MRTEELKSNWDKMHQQGLNPQKADDIKHIIEQGTTSVVSKFNKKLYKDISVLVVASITSALAIVFFYYRYNSLKHPWIDIELLFPIQVLSFVIFFVLFLFSFFQHKLVNQSFTAETVGEFLSTTLWKVKKYNAVFSIIISVLLFVTYSALLNYFIRPEVLVDYIIISSFSFVMTIISHLISNHYWNHSMRIYMYDLNSYLDELKSKQL